MYAQPQLEVFTKFVKMKKLSFRWKKQKKNIG